MKYRREFEIPYIGLKDGLHDFEYEIGAPFFEMLAVEHTDFETLNAKVGLVLDKHPGFFQLKFNITGKVTLPCDRCGDSFTMDLWDEFDLIVKLSNAEEVEETESEEDADIAYWPISNPILDVSEWIYEFILLSLPIQKVHPDDAEGNSTCNKESLEMLQMMKARAEANANKNNIWKGLDALKNKNNNN